MSRQKILGQIKQTFGLVPDYFSRAPDVVLEQWWTDLGWLQSDSALSAHEKVLVAFGAAAAIHCQY